MSHLSVEKNCNSNRQARISLHKATNTINYVLPYEHLS